jgi:sugar O-acyltransferase (sialic acid O-acetyltransferase NeuD family)
MKQLLIVGARGYGREVYNFAKECTGYGSDFAIKGFLDDKPDAFEGFSNYPGIIGPVETYQIGVDDVFACALGSVKHKRFYAEHIKARGGRFITLIHPAATVYSNTKFGEGCIVSQNTTISCDVVVGNFVTFHSLCTVGHDAKIGNYSQLDAYTFMGGYAELGDEVTLHTGAKILPNKKVGSGATVGAGSVVMHNVKPGATVFGMPAMPLNF